MVVQGQLDLGRLNKGLSILSKAFDNQAIFTDEGLELTIIKNETDEFPKAIIENVEIQINPENKNELIMKT
jgi:hypothetical protein